MDVDLSTDLDAFLPLVAPLLTGHSDVAIGSRLAPGARVVRGQARTNFPDLQRRPANRSRNSFSTRNAGFKALRAEVARELVPMVEDNGWFFDTELLVVAERNGARIHEVAVDWVDDAGSTVDIVRTASDDLKGIVRMMRGAAHGKGDLAPQGARALVPTQRPHPSPAGQFVHFAGVGIVSTVGYAFLFVAVLRHTRRFGRGRDRLGPLRPGEPDCKPVLHSWRQRARAAGTTICRAWRWLCCHW